MGRSRSVLPSTLQGPEGETKAWVCNDPAWSLTQLFAACCQRACCWRGMDKRRGGRKWWLSFSSTLWVLLQSCLAGKRHKAIIWTFYFHSNKYKILPGFVNREITVWTLVWLSVFISRFLRWVDLAVAFVQLFYPLLSFFHLLLPSCVLHEHKTKIYQILSCKINRW